MTAAERGEQGRVRVRKRGMDGRRRGVEPTEQAGEGEPGTGGNISGEVITMRGGRKAPRVHCRKAIFTAQEGNRQALLMRTEREKSPLNLRLWSFSGTPHTHTHTHTQTHHTHHPPPTHTHPHTHVNTHRTPHTHSSHTFTHT